MGCFLLSLEIVNFTIFFKKKNDSNTAPSVVGPPNAIIGSGCVNWNNAGLRYDLVICVRVSWKDLW